jgi:hypothetical protein
VEGAFTVKKNSIISTEHIGTKNSITRSILKTNLSILQVRRPKEIDI